VAVIELLVGIHHKLGALLAFDGGEWTCSHRSGRRLAGRREPMGMATRLRMVSKPPPRCLRDSGATRRWW